MSHGCYAPVLVMEVVEAHHSAIVLHSVTEHESWTAERSRRQPNTQTDPPGSACLSVSSGPVEVHQRDVAVNAEDGQKKHAGVHVYHGHKGVQLAHNQSEMPVEIPKHVVDGERQEEHKDKVSHSQVQEPKAIHSPFAFEACCPYDNSIPRETKDKGQAVNNH